MTGSAHATDSAWALPRLFVLTDRRASEAAGRCLTTTVAAVVEAGAPVIVLREKDLAPDDHRRLGEMLAPIVTSAGARLVVASNVALALHLDAWGVHLATSDAVPEAAPGHTPGRRHWALGRSCHDRAEVAAAADEPLDWVTLSPVYMTSSKPGYGPALGSDGLAVLATQAGCPPAMALGGIDARRVGSCLAAGAHGVAVMGAVMGSADPASTTAHLLRVIASLTGEGAAADSSSAPSSGALS